MTYARQVDGNSARIVAAVRKWFGAAVSVESLHRVGGGVPDLLIGYRGLTDLWEVKDPEQKSKLGKFARANRGLNEAEAKWHYKWNGRQVQMITSETEAIQRLKTLGLIADRMRE